MTTITHREKRWDYITPQDFATAEKNGISHQVAHTRVYKYGWEIDTAITRPLQKSKHSFPEWKEWKDKAVVCKSTFVTRRRMGWTEEEAAMKLPLTKKEIGQRRRVYTDEHLKIAENNGVSYRAMVYRINKMGWDIERAITTPIMSKKQAGMIRQGRKLFG